MKLHLGHHRPAADLRSRTRLQPLVPLGKLYPPTLCNSSSSSRSSASNKSSQACLAAPTKPSHGLSGADSKLPRPISDVSISGSENVAELLAALQGIAAEHACLSPEASRGLEQAVPPHALADIPALTLARLMLGIAAAGATMSQGWRDAALATTESHLATCPAESTMLLAELLWAVCEMKLNPSAQWLSTAEQAVTRSAEDGSFLGPQLSTCLCALGELGSQPPKPWVDTVTKEAEFQLAEFTSDFTPADIARLAIGLSCLKAEISTAGSSPLMKAVYSKVRTIEEKGLVDWALSKLDSEEKSMVFDPRWNHEELSMLPNREKDKRRILSEGWYRTQWGGWSPGGK